MKITNLTNAHGYWTATVHIGEQLRRVDRKHGSWQYNVSVLAGNTIRMIRRDVRPTVAAELQRAVRKLEKEGHGVRAASR